MSSDGLVVCHLPFGPTAYFTLYNVVMRHDVPDIGTMSEAFPHLIFHNFSSRLGTRVGEQRTALRARVVDILRRLLKKTIFRFGVQLIGLCAHAGFQYPQVPFPGAEGGQQARDHIRQPGGLHLVQVGVTRRPRCKCHQHVGVFELNRNESNELGFLFSFTGITPTRKPTTRTSR